MATERGLIFHVRGIPGAQGSKRHVGRGILVESSRKVAPWRSDVKAAAEAAIAELDRVSPWEPITGPARVAVDFQFTRPRGHHRTGRNAHLLRDNAPAAPVSRALGDIDKLVRSTLDALVAAGALADDSLVVSLRATKSWALSSGAVVSVGAIHKEQP